MPDFPNDEPAPPRAGSRIEPRLAFVLSIGVLAGFDAFALMRPLLEGTGYYAPRPHATGYAYTWPVLLLFAPYAIAVWAAGRDDGPAPRTVLVALVAVTIPLVAAPLIQSQDLYQYLFYGRMQVFHGANPYIVAPNAFAGDPWFTHVAWPAQRSVYGPVWSLIMAAIVWIAGGSLVAATLLAKTVAVGFEAITVWGLLVLGRDAPRRRTAVTATMFALNPLVLSAIALSGHADAAVAAAFVWAIVADRRDRSTIALVLLGVATLVKFYAGFVLVVYLVATLRRNGVRTTALRSLPSILFGAAAFVPYWRGPGTFAGVLSIARQTSASLAGATSKVLAAFMSGVDIDRPASLALNLVRIAGTVVLVAVFARQARSGSLVTEPWPAAMAVMAAYLLVTPWFLPWHAIGMLALACAVPGSALAPAGAVFSGSCFASIAGPGLVRPVATSVVRYGPPTLAYLRRTGIRPAASSR
ncbi:MAG: hypothetical protein ACXVEI_05295 [Actinomycetota bacterium]